MRVATPWILERMRYPTGYPSIWGHLPFTVTVRFASKEHAIYGLTSPTTQCRSNPVSGRGLPNTGIFQISAGDYRRFRSHSGQFRSPETDSRLAKARHWRAFLSLQRAKSPGAGLVGWGGRDRTFEWLNQNPAAASLASQRATILLRIDWLSRSIGALLS
jgi:hypothetical protein